MHYPTTDIQTEFMINRPINNTINATMKYFPHATDGRTDGRTDVMYDNNRYFFLEKRKKITKNTGMNSVCQLL